MNRLTIGLLLCAVVAGAGCSMPQRAYQPDQDPTTLDDISFLHYLATVPVATVDEGMQAILLLTGERGQWPTFDQAYEELRRRGAVRTTWHLKSNQLLDKGTLAYMLRTVCDLPHGLSEVAASRTGLGDRRYALKTCVHVGILAYGLPREPVTGGELLSSLTRAEGFLESPSPDIP